MGAEIATQSALNSRLHHYVRSPYLASAVSFLVGTLFLSLLTFLSKQPMMLNWQFIATNPWWIWLGGFTGAFALTTNILLFQQLGSIQTSVLPIMGQIIMSVAIDQFGLFNAQRDTFTLVKIVGLVILIIGTLTATGAFDQVNSSKTTKTRHSKKIGWQILGIIAGALLAIQAAVNGYLGHQLHSALLATTIAFTIGLIVLMILCLLQHVQFRAGVANAIKHTSPNWCMWLGGLLGSSYVAISAQLVPILGTGKVIVIALFGQLLFSTLIDQFGWFHATKHQTRRVQILGLIAMLVGIFMVDFI